MTQSKELSLSGKLTLEDFIKYNHYHMNRGLKLYFAVCFLVLFLILQMPMSGSFFLILFFAGIPALVLSSLLYVFARQVKKRQAINEYKSDQRIKHTISYTFSTDGVRQVVTKSDNHFEWEDFLELQEHTEMFLLYVSKNKAIVLPKRFFHSSGQMDDFRSKVSHNIAATKPEEEN